MVLKKTSLFRSVYLCVCFHLKKRKKVGLIVCESVVSSQLGTRLLKIEKILKGTAKHESSQKIEVFYSKNKDD